MKKSNIQLTGSGEILVILVLCVIFLKPNDIKKIINFIEELLIKANEYTQAIKNNIYNALNNKKLTNEKTSQPAKKEKQS
ncbi:MAG TPA: hypothetical protein V7791_01370 [Candidatus Azoamicus sp. OHIO1]